MAGFNWTVAGFIATSTGLVVSLVLGYISLRSISKISQTLNNLSKHDEDISRTMQDLYQGIVQRLEGLSKRDEDIIHIIQGLQTNIHDLQINTKYLTKIMETNKLVTNLEDWAWEPYLEQIQDDALNSGYLQPEAGNMKLTQIGRQLLDVDLIRKIEAKRETIKRDQGNVIIRQLGANYLFDKAEEKNVTLDIMVAVVHSYLQEMRE